MKKLAIKALFAGLFGLFGFATIGGLSLVNAQGGGAQNPFGNQENLGVNVPGAEGAATGDNTFIQVIRNFINRVLGLLGLIALIILLYGGFQMITAAGNEEKYKAGFKILKQAGIGLVFIGVSWLVVSLIFRVIGTVTTA